MPSSSFTTFAFLSALSLTSALGSVLPRNNGGSSSYSSDPAFTISTIQLDSVVSCIGGIENAKKPFLLVPGSKLSDIAARAECMAVK